MPLKKLFLLLIIAFTVSRTLAQKEKYTMQWKQVATLEKKGLFKSALKEVCNIYQYAKRDRDEVQQIKSCLYQFRYRNLLNEESIEKNIFYADTLIAEASSPAKNILQSIQADMYWQYLKDNRWELYDRTKLTKENHRDISTWSLQKLLITITTLYHSSLTNDVLLKQTKLDNMEAILYDGQHTRHLRPTLFDLLANRALKFFTNDETELTRPANLFTIKDPLAFASVNDFVNASFKTQDTISLQYQALLIFREILRFHLKDPTPDALVDADLARLNFVYQYAVNPDKEKLFEEALIKITENPAANASIAQANYLRANLYFEWGQTFDPIENTANQYALKKSRDLCDTTIRKFPTSEGGINCQKLLNQILVPTIALETELVNIPGMAFRSLVKYKNTKKIYLRIIRSSREQIKKMESYSDEALWKQYLSLQPARSWMLTLPDPQDYQEHSTEIKIDALETGVYLLLVSRDEQFSLKNNIISKQQFYVSNISFIHNNQNEYYVLHRDSGKPLAGTNIQVWKSVYNKNNNRDEDRKAEQYITDKNGFLKIKNLTEERNFNLQFKYETDELFLDEQFYNSTYNSFQPISEKLQSFLFTDRSIYRPGQTIYFKGIIIKSGAQTADKKLATSFSTQVQLKDANNQIINSSRLITNEFGSYHGSFILPAGSLNGYFSLFDSATGALSYFNVEEYKRPKFSVELQKPIGATRVYDSIIVKGLANAYSGNPVDGAAVKYRVVRRAKIPVWYKSDFLSVRSVVANPANQKEVEITNGICTTDKNGAFEIVFKALPDESLDKKEQPVFYYEINADVTDINGETRSGQTTIAAAYQSLQIEIQLPDQLPADSLKKIFVKTTNLNDVEEPALVNLSIQRLISPNRIFRERYWKQPDQFLLSKDVYYILFPYDVYENENQVSHYAEGEKVFEKTVEANRDGNLDRNRLKDGRWQPSWYKIVASTKDTFGEVVMAEKYIQLLSNEAVDPTAAMTVQVLKKTALPGEQINYTISTGFDKVWLIKNEERMNYPSTALLDSIQQPYPSIKYSIPVREEDRGGMSMSYAFVKHNRVYSGQETFEIPWSNTELHISFSAFRDKLLPGANETWRVNISGNRTEKLSAELLTSMYDASLDQFKIHWWNDLNIWPDLYSRIFWTKDEGFVSIHSDDHLSDYGLVFNAFEKKYDQLMSVNDYSKIENGYIGLVSHRYSLKGHEIQQVKFTPPKILADERIVGDELMIGDADSISVNMKTSRAKGNHQVKITASIEKNNLSNGPIQIRKNFNETAFFYPDLKTDAAGSITFNFTMPEALTQWKLMAFAHTKELASGYVEKTVLTQKPLMVQPNAPRFMREGDQMEFSAKIINLSDSELTGTASLELLDAATNKPVDGWFKNVFSNQYFTVAAGQSTVVKFPMEIPFHFNSALTYRVVAQSGSFSDGEEMSLPILSNRLLVTETLPINLRNTNQKKYRFEKLLNCEGSETIDQHALTVELNSNPVWYAVQALPFLMEYPYECAEQSFNRYFANILASHITASIPGIKAVFDKWQATDTAAMVSNLQKNEELKSALLKETPWVLEAQNEAQQKKNIALLFDRVKMNNELNKAIDKLKELQDPSGGFPWFKGGPVDVYITQYILAGIGHLKHLHVFDDHTINQSTAVMDIAKKALPFIDRNNAASFKRFTGWTTHLDDNNLDNYSIQYLYMRSFFKDNSMLPASQKAYQYYMGQIKKYWLSQSKYMQAMIALILFRNGDTVTANAIIRSLKENSISNEEMGMYWKEWNTGGWYWYQSPIESQALMIEAFQEIDKNKATVDELKTWLIKQKQTQQWETTRATAEACYAILLNGSNWTNVSQQISLQMGDSLYLQPENAEAGTGYLKKTITGKDVHASMGNMTLSRSTSNNQQSGITSYGAVYWQYFEDLDKITNSASPLRILKKLYLEKNTATGPTLEAIADDAVLHVGDKVKVRIELKVDRDLEYVHMKDMRAACLEPLNTISDYQYQDGLGYYQSTSDASTNFFFNRISKGSYVFEYPLFVTHTGNFSNGITAIQCMYAPAFSSHSEGIRINVEAP